MKSQDDKIDDKRREAKELAPKNLEQAQGGSTDPTENFTGSTYGVITPTEPFRFRFWRW